MHPEAQSRVIGVRSNLGKVGLLRRRARRASWSECVAVAMSSRVEALPSSRPHVLLLLADDFPWEMWPRAGNTQMQRLLPALSEHAVHNGLSLERHYAFRLCAPARASLLSGRFPPRAYELEGGMRACKGLSPGFTSLAEKLRDGAGYACHRARSQERARSHPACVALCARLRCVHPMPLRSRDRHPHSRRHWQMASWIRNALVLPVASRLRDRRGLPGCRRGQVHQLQGHQGATGQSRRRIVLVPHPKGASRQARATAAPAPRSALAFPTRAVTVTATASGCRHGRIAQRALQGDRRWA